MKSRGYKSYTQNSEKCQFAMFYLPTERNSLCLPWVLLYTTSAVMEKLGEKWHSWVLKLASFYHLGKLLADSKRCSVYLNLDAADVPSLHIQLGLLQNWHSSGLGWPVGYELEMERVWVKVVYWAPHCKLRFAQKIWRSFGETSNLLVCVSPLATVMGNKTCNTKMVFSPLCNPPLWV